MGEVTFMTGMRVRMKGVAYAPVMVVRDPNISARHAGSGIVECVWFSTDQKLQTALLYAEMLELCEGEPAGD